MVLEFVADIFGVVCEVVVNAVIAVAEPFVTLLAELLVGMAELVISGLFLAAGLFRSSSSSRFKISQKGRHLTRWLVYGLLAAGILFAAWEWLRPQPQATSLSLRPAHRQAPASKVQQALELFDQIKQARSQRQRE